MIIIHLDIFSIIGGGGELRSSSRTDDNRLLATLLVMGYIVVICVGGILKLVCDSLCKNQSRQEIKIVVNSIDQNLDKQEVYSVNPFQSGVWLSRYFQYETWHGPYSFPLSFYSQSKKIKGSGSDDVGIFTIDGTFSTETNQMNLIKTYQIETGDRKQNLGHQVTIQLTWNAQSRQFEGKWHVRISTYEDKGEFQLKLYPAYIRSKLLWIF